MAIEGAMGKAGAVILLVVMLAFLATIYGVIAGKRSAWIVLASAVVIALSALGAWYSWAESQSVGGTVVYLVILVVGLVAAVRQFSKPPA